VAAAKEAFKTWRKTPIGTRARIFLKYQQLIRENMSELAHILTAEQGKTLPDAEGDVFRGLEVVEHAAAIGNLQLGELANNVANGVDTYTIMQPLGVCAGTGCAASKQESLSCTFRHTTRLPKPVSRCAVCVCGCACNNLPPNPAPRKPSSAPARKNSSASCATTTKDSLPPISGRPSPSPNKAPPTSSPRS
jgi:hypothetical protein